MLALIEIVAIVSVLVVVILGVVTKLILRRNLDDIDGVSEVFEQGDDGTPIAKL